MTTPEAGQANGGAGLGKAQAAWMRALAGRRPALRMATALPLLSGLLLLPQLWALARALHKLVVGQAGLATAMPWLALAAALVLARAVLSWAAERAAQQAAEQAKAELRGALFRRLLQAGVLWSRGRASGELADAIVARVESLDGYIARFLPAMAAAAVLPLVSCVVLAGFDWVAALVLVLTVPLIPVFMALVGWGAEAAGRRHATALTRLSGLFADRVRGLTTLKLHGRAEAEAARVLAASEETRERTLAVLRVAFLSSAVLEFFAALGVASLALYFGLSLLGMVDLRLRPLDLETALFCLMMAPEVYLPMRQLAAHYHDRANARAAVAEIERLFDGLPDMVEGARAVSGAGTKVAPAPACIRIAQLQMPVPGRGTVRMPGPVQVEAGQWVALVGPSGSGKSTLLETLAGLRPYGGSVRLGDAELVGMAAAELRSQVLLVTQRPWLAPGSIADNLRLLCPDASDARLYQALEAAGLASLVDRLPQGLGTQLGQRGQGLSGGQAQRLALARMFLSQAPVLLLDEPTAHLDEASRDQVLAQIRKAAAGRTLVIATHDPVVAGIAGQAWKIGADGEVRA